MPVKSEAQWRFFQMAKRHPRKMKRKAPSKAVIREFLKHGKPKQLPERA